MGFPKTEPVVPETPRVFTMKKPSRKEYHEWRMSGETDTPLANYYKEQSKLINEFEQIMKGAEERGFKWDNIKFLPKRNQIIENAINAYDSGIISEYELLDTVHDWGAGAFEDRSAEDIVTYFKGRKKGRKSITGKATEQFMTPEDVDKFFSEPAIPKVIPEAKPVTPEVEGRKFVSITKETTKTTAPWRVTYTKGGKEYAYHETSKAKAIATAKEKLGVEIDTKTLEMLTTPITPEPEIPKSKPVALGVTTKEPWQMTSFEFLESEINRIFKEKGRKLDNTAQLLVSDMHYDIVKAALSEGKPVPAEVLKDYPDLAKAIPKAPSKVRATGVKKVAKATRTDKTVRENGEGKSVSFNPQIAKVMKSRSNRAVSQDAKRQARRVFNSRDATGVGRWARHPSRYDIEGVDTLGVIHKHKK